MTESYELRIRIERGAGKMYRIFAEGPFTEGSGTFKLPFDDKDLELFALRVSGRARKGTRRAESSEMHQITEFGSKLFDAVFQGEIGAVYQRSRSAARQEQKRLRMTLALTSAPKLARLPWEYLYEAPRFLAISEWTPMVRYLEMPGERRALKVELPLRILAMVSSPDGEEPLNVALERRHLEEALHTLVESGAVEIVWLEDATLPALLRTLEGPPFHIFHYIGHGLYDERVDDGVLLLEGEGNRARRVTGAELGRFLSDHTTFRLAVLNACEGALGSPQDAFAGVAAGLVQHEFPAVIAMQFEITDRAAIVFARDFYWKLADCGQVDVALAYARKAIHADGNDVEWGSPVLFMRVRDGEIFDVPDAPVEPPVARPGDPKPTEDEPPPDTKPTEDVPPPVDPESEPRPRRRIPALAWVGAGLAAVVGVAVLAVLLTGGGKDGGATTAATNPTTTAARKLPRTQQALPAAIPSAFRQTCSSDRRYVIPKGLRVTGYNRTGVPTPITFESSYGCEAPALGVSTAEYSHARSSDDLDGYFSWRANGHGLNAFALQNRCGSDEKANNHWDRAGRTGHTLVTKGGGLGRVLCYDMNGTSRIEWTDPGRLVYSIAQGPNRDELFRWWQTAAGPSAP